MNLFDIDIALRGASSGLLLLLAIAIWTSRIARDAQFAFSVLVTTMFARVWSTLPETAGMPDQLMFALRFIGSGGAVSVTWFMLTIFLDDRRFAGLWLASGALISVWIVLSPMTPETVPILRAFALVHFAGLLVMIAFSAKGDLQDARRRIRPAMSSFLLIYCIGLSLTSRPMQDARPIEAALFQSGALLFFVGFFAIWALKANMSHWPGQTAPRSASAPNRSERASEQNILVTRIQQAMDAGVWQTEGLTVSALAQKVNAPEHQVRKAINQVLGHRNFASFINRARIDAAKAKLCSEETSGSTILEIAYDVGFSSLGPFNRAFRDATGQSPTDFRKSALTQREG